MAVALLVVPATACSSGDDASSPATTADAAAAGSGPFATGRRDVTFVDRSRPTSAVPGRLAARPDRTLPVRIMYPTAGRPGPEPALDDPEGASARDAPPRPGSFPLVVLSHGYNGDASNLQGLADRVARQGYVVVLPTFPLSRAGVGVLSDVANQPADVSYLLDRMLDLPDGDPLAGHVDRRHVAVGGHSLGAITTLGVTYNSCCRDARIDAAIPISGLLFPFRGGDYRDMPAVPLLLAHGAADAMIPVSAGDAIFAAASPPAWYLRTARASHSGVLRGAEGELLADAVEAFLAAYLEGDHDALDDVAAEVEGSGLGEWRAKAG